MNEEQNLAKPAQQAAGKTVVAAKKEEPGKRPQQKNRPWHKGQG